MRVVDELYGEFHIVDRLLVDLLESRAVERLGSVSQAGASSLVRPGRTVTRAEHSVGVMLLARVLGASLLEQAAGLLQDISHTAFSHTIDYVFDDRNEEYHEKIMRRVVDESDVPAVLQAHGLVIDDLMDVGQFRIIEAPAPALCADRIDYTLRDLVRFGSVTPENARAFVDQLVVVDGTVAVGNVDGARAFARWYHVLVSELFMNPLELWAHDRFASVIRDGMRRGLADEADLLGTDRELEMKLTNDPELAARIAGVRGMTADRLSAVQEDYRVFSKARVIDPHVWTAGRLQVLSSIDPAFSAMWDDIRERARDGVRVGVVKEWADVPS